jgi:PPM family protein phosphatase
MILSMTRKGTQKGPNEDRNLIKRYDNGAFLIAVADGIGGEPAGDLAAHIAVESLEGFNKNSDFPLEDLIKSIRAAGRAILKEVARKQILEGMGTTVTAVFNRDNLCHWIHVGDSRLYFVREKMIKQITEDHTPAGTLLAEGEITKEEARIHPLRSLLFECVGCGDFSADTGTFRVTEGDILLLATDGLYNELPEETIAEILHLTPDLKENLRSLVVAALDAGSEDDLSVVGAQIKAQP